METDETQGVCVCVFVKEKEREVSLEVEIVRSAKEEEVTSLSPKHQFRCHKGTVF